MISFEGRNRLPIRFKMMWVWHVFYILYSLEAGIFLIFLPWLRIWEDNYLLYLYPTLRPIVTNPFLRGAVIGLGIANLIIGVQEIVHFRHNLRHRFSS